MLETMYAAPGIGLAATQVNVHKRIIVVDVSEANDQPHTLINPVLETHGKKIKSEEGCLSVPEIYESVERFEYVNVTAQGVDGRPIELLPMACYPFASSTMRSLGGKLFVDYLSSLKRAALAKNCVNESARLADQPSKLRLAFAGSPDFAARILAVLQDSSVPCEFVLTQPDRPSGRGRKLTPNPVKTVAANWGLPVCSQRACAIPHLLQHYEHLRQTY